MKTIQFTIASRGALPTEAPDGATETDAGGDNGLENEQEQSTSGVRIRRLVPRLRRSGKPVNARTFFRHCPWGTIVTEGDMALCLGELQRLLLHELRKGAAVNIPGLGTLQVSLSGTIEQKDGRYFGRDVHVDGLRFIPDSSLLAEVRQFEVDQQPYGLAPTIQPVDIDALLDDLFSRQSTITRRDLELAAGLILSKHRLSDLLRDLVASGKLIKEGRGNQTRYRKP